MCDVFSNFPSRIVLKINPVAMHSILERVAAEEDDDGHFHEDEEGNSHSLKDFCDFKRPEPSPFSSRRVMFENEEVWYSVGVVHYTEITTDTTIRGESSICAYYNEIPPSLLDLVSL